MKLIRLIQNIQKQGDIHRSLMVSGKARKYSRGLYIPTIISTLNGDRYLFNKLRGNKFFFKLCHADKNRFAEIVQDIMIKKGFKVEIQYSYSTAEGFYIGWGSLMEKG